MNHLFWLPFNWKSRGPQPFLGGPSHARRSRWRAARDTMSGDLRKSCRLEPAPSPAFAERFFVFCLFSLLFFLFSFLPVGFKRNSSLLEICVVLFFFPDTYPNGTSWKRLEEFVGWIQFRWWVLWVSLVGLAGYCWLVTRSCWKKIVG